MPWAALARLQVPGVSRCTAFLVEARMAVTAAHCLYSRRLGHFVPPEAVHLLLGYDKGAFAWHATALSYAVAPGYDTAAGATNGALDVAVVRLPESLRTGGGTLLLVEGTLAPGTPLMLGGYSQDRAEAVLADTACAVRGYAGNMSAAVLVHDCEGTRGTSGAPLLARDGAGTWRVAGVQATGQAGRAGGGAVPASAIRDLLRHVDGP